MECQATEPLCCLRPLPGVSLPPGVGNVSHVCKLAYHMCIALGLGPRRGLFCFSPASTPRVRVMADNDALPPGLMVVWRAIACSRSTDQFASGSGH